MPRQDSRTKFQYVPYDKAVDPMTSVDVGLPAQPLAWGTSDVVKWLHSHRHGIFIPLFEARGVTGSQLIELDRKTLENTYSPAELDKLFRDIKRLRKVCQRVSSYWILENRFSQALRNTPETVRRAAEERESQDMHAAIRASAVETAAPELAEFRRQLTDTAEDMERQLQELSFSFAGEIPAPAPASFPEDDSLGDLSQTGPSVLAPPRRSSVLVLEGAVVDDIELGDSRLTTPRSSYRGGSNPPSASASARNSVVSPPVLETPVKGMPPPEMTSTPPPKQRSSLPLTQPPSPMAVRSPARSTWLDEDLGNLFRTSSPGTKPKRRQSERTAVPVEQQPVVPVEDVAIVGDVAETGELVKSEGKRTIGREAAKRLTRSFRKLIGHDDKNTNAVTYSKQDRAQLAHFRNDLSDQDKQSALLF